MKATKLILSTLGLSALAFASACGPYDSYDDFLELQGTVTADDGVTPEAGINFDELDATFVVSDGAEIVRSVAFNNLAGYTGNFFTDSNGQFDLLRHNLDLFTQQLEDTTERVCDSWDKYGICDDYVYVPTTQLVTTTYALEDIISSKSQLSFRSGSATITIPGQTISHGKAPQVTESPNNFRRAWVMNDLYVSPFAAGSSSGEVTGKGVPHLVGKPTFTKYADITDPARKAIVDGVVAKLNAFATAKKAAAVK